MNICKFRECDFFQVTVNIYKYKCALYDIVYDIWYEYNYEEWIVCTSME